MVSFSRTGLLESEKKKVKRRKRVKKVEFHDLTRPAPYTLRPFAGIYNPFPYGCSILCNHPADDEARDIVRKIRDAWICEGKICLLPEELEAIQAGLIVPQTFHTGQRLLTAEGHVPEELFRRYTDTDSRPVTPTPTVASLTTKSSARRCVTPEPAMTRERKLLLVDLRRSHSIETLSWKVSVRETTPAPSPAPERPGLPPLTSSTKTPRQLMVEQVKLVPHPPPVPVATVKSVRFRKPQMKKKATSDSEVETSVDRSEADQESQMSAMENAAKRVSTTIAATKEESDEEASVPKRRGKKLRKKGKKHGRGASDYSDKEVKGIPDPKETQISSLGDESPRIPSHREATAARPEEEVHKSDADDLDGYTFGDSFLPHSILKLLQRELNREILDAEFHRKRRRALDEAMRTQLATPSSVRKRRQAKRRDKYQLDEETTDFWLKLPRSFSRRSARFDLPLDITQLSEMTPLQYAQKHVYISSSRMTLYNTVYNRYKEKEEEEAEVDFDSNEHNGDYKERILLSKNLIPALGEVMGKQLSQEHADEFRRLIGWSESDVLDFRTFCGMAALCERLLSPVWCPPIPPRSEDPCHEIEVADFGSLHRRLSGLNLDPRLREILFKIRNL